MRSTWAISLIALSLAGCADEPDTQSKNATQVAGQSHQTTVYDAQLEVLDDANGIEQLTLDTAAKQRKLIESASQ